MPRTPSRDSRDPKGHFYAIPTSEEISNALEELAIRASEFRANGGNVVVVQGLGFVGAAEAAAIAAARDADGSPRYLVIGVDLAAEESYWKVASINEGRSPIDSPDPELDRLIREAVVTQGNLVATTSEHAYGLADVITVDIHLDVANRGVFEPHGVKVDLEGFTAGVRSIGRNMREDALLLVGTTVPVGTTEKEVFAVLREEFRKRGINAQPRVAHAYERVMPGPHYVTSVHSFWRTFSGIDRRSAIAARQFLSSYIDTERFPLWELNDTASSELAKLLENSYRAANIAFIQEWTLLAERIGVNLFEVIRSIRVRSGTHDNMRFPGFGVGGYCLTKDSLLAQWAMPNMYQSELTLPVTIEALRINHEMPVHTADLLGEGLDGSLSGRRVTLCGVSYLPGLADTRNSPAEQFVDTLSARGCEVIAHDPFVHHWQERPNVPVMQDLEQALAETDGAVFAVAHEVYGALDIDFLVRLLAGRVVIDAQDILEDEKAHALHKAGSVVLGVGKGHWRKWGLHRRQATDDTS